MDPAQGFAAQGAGAAVILSASHVGFPLSTTHVISGGDHGRGRRQAALRRALGRRRATSSIAWVLTLPASAAVGAPTYGVVQLFGTARPGPIVVSCLLLGLRRAAFARPRRRGRRHADGGGDVDARSRVEVSQHRPRSSGSRCVAGIGITTIYLARRLRRRRATWRRARDRARRRRRGLRARSPSVFAGRVLRRRRARRDSHADEVAAGYCDRPQHARGRAGGDRERRQVGRHDRVGADHAALADRHAAGDDDVRAAPDVVADPRRALAS